MLNNNKKFNGTSWKFDVYIYNSDVIQENFQSNESDSLKADSFIPTKNILYFSIDNSISELCPKAMFKIVDPQYGVSNKIRRQNTFLKVEIEKLMDDASDEPSDQKINLTFLITDYKIVSFSEESITYEIMCELDLSVLLNKTCEYATNPEKPENPLNIAYEILKQVNYPLYQTEVKVDNSIKRTRWYPPVSDTEINFITYQNMTVKNALKYLLSITGINCESPVYLMHNLTDNKSFLSSRTHLLRDEWIESAPGVTKIQFNFASNMVGPSHNMKFLKTAGEVGGSETSKLLANYTFTKYDHIKREWDSVTYDRDALDDTLTGFRNDREKSLLRYGNIQNDPEFKYEFIPYSEPFLNDVLRDLDLYSSSVQFTVDGNLKLDVGEIIMIQEMQNDPSKSEQFFGLWMISKVRHSFKDQLFKTNIICTRTTFLENLAIKK